MTGSSLPENLKNEGNIMLQTLVGELKSSGHKQISVTRDARCQLIDPAINEHIIETSLNEELPDLIHNADIIWLVAPETDDTLASLTDLILKSDAMVIACTPESIRNTASKFSTFKILKNANIDTIETSYLNDSIPESSNGWIIKPDDGVGGENCQRIQNIELLNNIKSENDRFIIQPNLPGKHLSMSLLVYDEDVRLLSCNKQYIDWVNETPVIKAIGINECLEMLDDFQSLAQNIIKVFPGLAGYVGVDLIKTENTLKVVEINPRFTTALAGLSQSLGINITETILNVFLTAKLPDIDLSKASPVKINV